MMTTRTSPKASTGTPMAECRARDLRLGDAVKLHHDAATRQPYIAHVTRLTLSTADWVMVDMRDDNDLPCHRFLRPTDLLTVSERERKT